MSAPVRALVPSRRASHEESFWSLWKWHPMRNRIYVARGESEAVKMVVRSIRCSSAIFAHRDFFGLMPAIVPFIIFTVLQTEGINENYLPWRWLALVIHTDPFSPITFNRCIQHLNPCNRRNNHLVSQVLLYLFQVVQIHLALFLIFDFFTDSFCNS